MKWILLLLLLLPVQALAQQNEDKDPEFEKTILVINPFTSTVVLSEFDKTQINKIMLKASSRQQTYQIALGELGEAKKSKHKIHHMQLDLIKNEEDFHSIKALLIDEKNKKVINKITEEKVTRLDLLRMVEDVLLRLFGAVPPEPEKDKEGKKKPKNLMSWP
jgi:hypothetical protein